MTVETDLRAGRKQNANTLTSLEVRGEGGRIASPANGTLPLSVGAGAAQCRGLPSPLSPRQQEA